MRVNSSISSGSQSSMKNGKILEKLRASIISLSQGYTLLEDRIVKSREILYNNNNVNLAAVKTPGSFQTLSPNMRYQEDALCIKHRCENYQRCNSHDICMTFYSIVREYRQLEEKASKIFDIFETITDKSQICVVAILINKFYKQKLDLEMYFS